MRFVEVLARLFSEFTGSVPVTITRLKGDASMRSIYRLSNYNQSAIGVFGPNLRENAAFIGFTKSFLRLGFPVPELYHLHKSVICYLLEDLGDVTLFARLMALRLSDHGEFPRMQVIPFYISAVEQLIQFQLRSLEKINTSLCYQTQNFDSTAWKIDHDYFLICFVDTLLPHYAKRKQIEVELAIHREMLESYSRKHFLYRDFQSRNIMITRKGLKFIDYQSGRNGALMYDIASLLYDARADLPQDFRAEVFQYYVNVICHHRASTEKELRDGFAPYALLRVLQALGSYGNIGIIRGNPDYIAAIPYGVRNALELLKSDSRLSTFSELIHFFKQIQENQSGDSFSEGMISDK